MQNNQEQGQVHTSQEQPTTLDVGPHSPTPPKYKSTPGPWQIVFRTLQYEINGGERPVCSLAGIFQQADTERANALLIAAAPDLLEAAVKALADCCDLVATDAGNALEAAIEKAVGP